MTCECCRWVNDAAVYPTELIFLPQRRSGAENQDCARSVISQIWTLERENDQNK